MTEEFIKKRIREQELYILGLYLRNGGSQGMMLSSRKLELHRSAQGQLEYFRNMLMHVCKYCGATTYEDAEICYKNPNKIYK